MCLFGNTCLNSVDAAVGASSASLVVYEIFGQIIVILCNTTVNTKSLKCEAEIDYCVTYFFFNLSVLYKIYIFSIKNSIQTQWIVSSFSLLLVKSGYIDNFKSVF